MSSIGARLRKERENLGLSQEDFSKITGLTRESQLNYEAGKRSPKSDYWAIVAAVGIDVQYVLTSVHSLNLDEVVRCLACRPVPTQSAEQVTHSPYTLDAVVNVLRHMTGRQRAYMQELEGYLADMEQRLETVQDPNNPEDIEAS